MSSYAYLLVKSKDFLVLVHTLVSFWEFGFTSVTHWNAGELRAKGANLTLMIQADMLAYHAAGEPPQLGLPDL